MHIKNKDNKNNYQTIKELADKFFQLEEKYGLVDLNVSGVKVWQCIRCKLFTSMAAEVFNLGIAHDSRASSLGEIISMLCNSLRSSSLLGGSHDIVVFPHQRVRLVEGRYIDINTESFVGELLSENRDILVLERPYAKTHLAESNEYTKYLDDSIIFTHLFKRCIRPKLYSSQQLINDLDREFEDVFNVTLDFYSLFKEAIQHFKISYMFYSFLLKRIKPNQIYVVVSYAYPSLVRAAKDLDIEVTELQHGAFSKYHLGYSYNCIRDVDYFPDKFLAWNEFWRNIAALPLKKEDIGIYPFRFQVAEVEKYRKIPKIRNQVVVISQGPIADKMCKIILDNFDFFQDKSIKYKLHPGELKSYKDSYFVTQLLLKENVDLVIDDNLYELFASSEYQVGVYSTALYEGLEFGLKTILCNTMFVEYMEELIDLDKVYLVLDEKI